MPENFFFRHFWANIFFLTSVMNLEPKKTLTSEIYFFDPYSPLLIKDCLSLALHNCMSIAQHTNNARVACTGASTPFLKCGCIFLYKKVVLDLVFDIILVIMSILLIYNVSFISISIDIAKV